MSESLWLAGEEYLKAQLLADMGGAGDYTSLVLDSVKVWPRFDVSHFTNLPLPLAVISSFSGSADPAGHGAASRTATEDEFRFVLSFVCAGNRETANTNAKILLARGLKLLKTLRFGTVVDDDDNKLDRVIRGDTMFRYGVDLWDKLSSEAEQVYGIGYVDFYLRGVTA